MIDASVRATRTSPDPARERELLQLRHQALSGLPHGARPDAEPDPARALPVDPRVGLPVLRGKLEAEVVRATIATHGCIVVPGLLPERAVTELRSVVETALAAQEGLRAGSPPPGASDWCHPYPSLRDAMVRAFAAGILAVDTPRGLGRYLGALEDAGMLDMVQRYFGGPVAISAEKTVFRTTNEIPPAGYGWHQDGVFLGGERIRTLDVWITLTAAGRHSPGLEILPRRVDRILPPGAMLGWDLSSELIAQHYPGFTTVTPELGPGDAVLFDQLCVHRTGGLEEPTDTRVSIECWMFGPESVPDQYTGFLL